MAVKIIKSKRLEVMKKDHPNYKSEPKPEKVVNGNLKELYEEEEEDANFYDEGAVLKDKDGNKKHFYQPDNGNLQMTELMTGLMNKLDNFNGNTYNENMLKGSRAVEIDIKREIAVGKVDTNAVTSEVIKGKVNNKVNKLKALRKRNKK